MNVALNSCVLTMIEKINKGLEKKDEVPILQIRKYESDRL